MFLVDLTYADDIVLLDDNEIATQEALNNIDHFAKVFGLRINAATNLDAIHHQPWWCTPVRGWVFHIPRLFLYGNWPG